MQLVSKTIDQPSLVIAPIGDIQWSGQNGPTAKDHLRRHIDNALEHDAYFIGMGDYIDFMSPSNRQKFQSAGFYDTVISVIDEKALELTKEVYDTFLKDTKGRWLGMLEGHHFSLLADGTTSDSHLANWLEAPLLGSSALVRVRYSISPLVACSEVYGPFGSNCTLPLGHKGGHKHGVNPMPTQEVTLWVHHGKGGGSTPGAPLNTLNTVARSWDADVFIMGHTCMTPATRFSRPKVIWDNDDNGGHKLDHKDILLVNSGGFSKSFIENSIYGRVPRGGYAEIAMMNPAPISAPFIYLNDDGSTRVEL